MVLMGTRAMMAYMMSGTDGASSTPSALALVTKPMPRRSGNPAFISSGSSRPPSAKMVTPLPPVSAVKHEHNTAAASAVPVMPPPNSAVNNTPSRAAAPVRANTKPARVNSGSAGSDGLTVIW